MCLIDYSENLKSDSTQKYIRNQRIPIENQVLIDYFSTITLHASKQFSARFYG